MIVVDSSVWIDHLNDHATPEVRHLRALVGREAILVGDLVLLEVLQGLRDEREATLVERALRRFDIAPMLDPELASRAALQTGSAEAVRVRQRSLQCRSDAGPRRHHPLQIDDTAEPKRSFSHPRTFVAGAVRCASAASASAALPCSQASPDPTLPARRRPC